MAGKKKTENEILTEIVKHVTDIKPLSVDYGREDLNNMGRKINEIIEFLNK